MVDLQNLAYALIQLAHNFGAVTVTGGAVAALACSGADAVRQRRLVWLILAGWLLQAASGAGFGAVSYAYYGQFPDIHGIAVVALAIKMVCAVSGGALAAAYLIFAGDAARQRGRAMLIGLATFAVIALSAAAFLRWFS